jgi:hypothetical protein
MGATGKSGAATNDRRRANHDLVAGAGSPHLTGETQAAAISRVFDSRRIVTYIEHGAGTPTRISRGRVRLLAI